MLLVWGSLKCHIPLKAFINKLMKIEEHVDFKNAVQCEKCANAINEELRALERNNTWKITTLPADKRAIQCTKRVQCDPCETFKTPYGLTCEASCRIRRVSQESHPILTPCCKAYILDHYQVIYCFLSLTP